ncbi:hypothetical protein BSNK01_02100 [Bacillaceae bacterium]
MRFVSFNPLRTIGIPGVVYVKPEAMFREKEVIKDADVILFPEYWQLGSLVHGLKKAIFPSLATIQLGLNKIEQTRALQMLFPEVVPYTLILANTESNRQRVLEEMPLPFVAKEAKNAMGRGVFLIENEEDFSAYARSVDVLYVQEKLPIDKDLRIVYIGNEVVAAYWRIAKEGNFRSNVAQGAAISFREPVPREAIDLVERVAKTFGINHAGFDVAQVGDRFYIFEFNALFGNEALRQIGISPEEKIYQYLLQAFAPKPYPTSPLRGIGKAG